MDEQNIESMIEFKGIVEQMAIDDLMERIILLEYEPQHKAYDYSSNQILVKTRRIITVEHSAENHNRHRRNEYSQAIPEHLRRSKYRLN